MKITRKTKMSKVLEKNPKAAQELIGAGMHCVGCPMAMQETLEMGCKAHGMKDKDIEELVKKLNKVKKQE
ncbi:DUF1858 domain-containing protein [Candidatus Pacearchaeota archaeon]|nr:DUF1858 domain-containing protein [Candidatus Pacearchaeota archaeon]